MKRISRVLILASLLFFSLILLPDGAAAQQAGQSMLKPPSVKKVPKKMTIHGDTRTDDYFWLREKENPEVATYLEAENAYTDAVMKPTEALQTKLYNEMVGRIKETDVNVPYKSGGYFYYSRTEKGKQYPIMCRKRGSLDAPEEITLDLNELARGRKYLGLGAYTVSDDGNLLAYSTDFTGYRQYTLQIKDLRNGQLLPDRIEKTISVEWAGDNRTLFYTTEDAAKRPYRFYRHTVGQPDATKDALLYEEKDEIFRVSADRSRDKAYIFLYTSSAETSEVRYVPSDRPEADLQLIAPRRENHEYYADHRAGLFYIRTNDGAKNYRLVTAPVADPRMSNWKEVIPARDKVKLDGVELFAKHMVLAERDGGLQKIRVVDSTRNETHDVDFPEPVYSVFAAENYEFDTTTLRFRYQSLVTPASVYDYDMKTRERKLLKRTEVLGGYDPAQYQSERVFAPATDGTRIPVSIVYKKGTKRDGKSPLLLYSYGAYGSSLTNNFNSSRLSLLDRGVIFAQAHIRGGGDLGEEWHDQGKMLAKKNTFTDFINAAEFLVKEKYTSSDRLAVTGASAGGLLMGAVTNMRPDLFKAVVSYVPYVDVINTMLDASIPLTVNEYLEWGNPNELKQYEYMKSYDPYGNLAAKNYPTLLVRASFNDSQVPYWEAAKYVAKMRALKTDRNQLLLKTNMGAGHGGASGRYDSLRDLAFDYAFILTQFGITQ